MAFSDRIAQETLARLFYVKISGIPYYFSNAAKPASWSLPAGYSWSVSLDVPEGWATVSTEAQIHDGITQAGTMPVSFWLKGNQDDPGVDVWSDLFLGSIRRTDKNQTEIRENLDVDDTVEAIVGNTTGFAASGDVYAGLETIGYDSKIATKFQTLARGKYGSRALYHVGKPDHEIELGAGGYWTDYPIAWKERDVEVWFCTGEVDQDGSFSPYGAAPESAEDRNIYSGIVQDIKRSDDGLKVEISTANIVQKLSREVAARLPRARAGLSPAFVAWFQVAPDNWHIAWRRVRATTSPIGSQSWASFGDGTSDARLIRLESDSLGTKVPEAIYSTNQLANRIAQTISNYEDPGLDNVSCNIELTGAGRDLRVVVKISYDYIGMYQFDLELAVTRGPKTNFWRELGFTENTTSRPDSLLAGNAPYTYEFVAQRPPPLFRWPRADYPSRRLYLWNLTGPAFTATPVYKDDDGGDVPMAVKVGKSEIVTISSVGTDRGLTYLVVDERGVGGSFATEEVYVEHNDEDQRYEEVVQGISFLGAGVSSMRMALYLMLGGSGVSGHNHATYDRGWRGSGAYIKSDFVDVAALEAYHYKLLPRRTNYFFSKAEELRKVIPAELVIDRMFALPRYSSAESRYQISVSRVEPPNDSDDATARILDESILWETAPGGLPYNEGRELIVNAVDTQAVWDNIEQRYLWSDVHHLQANSIATWGLRRPVKVSIRGIAGVDEALAKAKEAADSIFTGWAQPFVVVEFTCVKAAVWEWDVGDVVAVTSRLMPRELQTGRGVTSLLGRIYAKRDTFNPGMSSANGRDSAIFSILTIAFRRFGGLRYGLWSPSVHLASKSSDTVWQASDYYYSSSVAAKQDWKHVASGWRMRAFHAGAESTAQKATILSISPTGEITFVAPGITLAAPVELESVNYDDAGIHADQRKYVYMSDGDGDLDYTGGPDGAYTYQ